MIPKIRDLFWGSVSGNRRVAFFTYFITLLTAKLHRERDKLASSQLTAVTAVHWKHYSQRSGKSNKQSLRKN